MVTAMVAKGSTIRSTLDFIRAEKGATELRRVLARLPEPTRHAAEATEATAEVPYSLVLALWRAADQVLGGADPQWIERAGAFSIESLGVQLYSGILRKTSPVEFLTQSVSLFQLYYHPGDMQVVEQESGRAVLRLSGFASDDVLFCRRQTGGLRCALGLAGGQAPRVRHVRCAHAGDGFCEWELKWSV